MHSAHGSSSFFEWCKYGIVLRGAKHNYNDRMALHLPRSHFGSGHMASALEKQAVHVEGNFFRVYQFEGKSYVRCDRDNLSVDTMRFVPGGSLFVLHNTA